MGLQWKLPEAFQLRGHPQQKVFAFYWLLSFDSGCRVGAGDLPPTLMTFRSSDSRIIVREPTFVRCNFPWLSQA
jgi:hypothetical protein